MTSSNGDKTAIRLPVAGPGFRPSKMGRRRALVLLAVHVLIIAHIVQWLVTGTTLSPVEPSEAMYTLNQGLINAGFIFFGCALLATLIFGRFVCGWGCHFIAYQDLCAWLLKKLGIKPKPFRSRWMVYGPLCLALYMFVVPTVYRVWTGAPSPEFSNHLMTSEFWATFPGWMVAVMTFLVAGAAIVYFLGSKGFCTYACPYGGFFRAADRVSVGRIVVSDACQHCGHCTAACTSNVRVHEEVARFGMVVNPGCMKCMDCVSVCPNDALSFGFKSPKPAAPHALPEGRRRYDFSRWQELQMLVWTVVSLLVWRGLYGQIPLLLAMGLAAMSGFLLVKATRLLHVANERWQNLQLKRSGALTRSGKWFLAIVCAYVLVFLHSGFVRYNAWTGQRARQTLTLGDEIWQPGFNWQISNDSDQRIKASTALTKLSRADQWGLLSDRAVLTDLVWLYLALDQLPQAEQAVRRVVAGWPDLAESHRGLAGVLKKMGRAEEALRAYRVALELDPEHELLQRELVAHLVAMSRLEEAMDILRHQVEKNPANIRAAIDLSEALIRIGRTEEALSLLSSLSDTVGASSAVESAIGTILLRAGRLDDAISHLERALELDEADPESHYNLGYALLGLSRTTEALPHLQRAVQLRPGASIYQYNLGVGLFMDSRPQEALISIEQAIQLAPDDPTAWGFKSVVLDALGDQEGASAARARAAALSQGKS